MQLSKRLFNLETETAFAVLAKANMLASKGKDIISDIKKLGCPAEDSNLKSVYKPNDYLSYKYVGGNPRVKFTSVKSYFHIKQRVGSNWVKIRDDNDWDTSLRWQRSNLGSSFLTISWQIPSDQEEGYYKISYEGYAMPWVLNKKTEYYKKESPIFEIRKDNKALGHDFTQNCKSAADCCSGCCENGQCVEKVKDWAGAYYCPSQCKGSIGAKKGTCNQKNTKKKVGESCNSSRECDNFGFGTSKGTACCKNTCQIKKKDWIGAYYCPHECKKSIFAKPGTCK